MSEEGPGLTQHPNPLTRRVPSGVVVAVAALLAAAVLGLRIASGDAADGTLVLLIVPIAMCAIEFGLRGGLVASLGGFLLLLGWEALSDQSVGALGVATRATAYFVVGGLVGRFVDERRGMASELSRHYELSLDMFCTASFDGYFERVNPAWEKALGYTPAQLLARPFVEFVHPDDRERTQGEAAHLMGPGAKTVSFRNRYRTAAGEYRWLEWKAHAVADQQRIYATARDITAQQRAEEALQNQSLLLERTVRERTQALEEARLDILKRLAVAAEYRDDDTHQHTERVGRTAALIAQHLGHSEEALSLIRRAAPLHDVGKVGISDLILLKPGKLTPEEFRLMQEHVRIGARILANGKFAVLRLAEEIAGTHHERWDGSGYPAGLAGNAIPIAGRIVAVADVFDALAHPRPYKDAWPVDRAVAEVERLAGEHFDPAVVHAFANIDHRRLLARIEDFDLALPAPPLVAPAQPVPA